MRTVKDIEIKYFEKGKEKTQPLQVSFISNKVTRDFTDLMKSVNDVKNRWDEVQDFTTENSKLRIERPSGWKDKIKENEAQIKEIANKIADVGNSDFFERRFEIMKRILLDNGCEKEELLSFEFWDEKVDPSDMMQIMTDIIYKDLTDYKKKTQK